MTAFLSQVLQVLMGSPETVSQVSKVLRAQLEKQVAQVRPALQVSQGSVKQQLVWPPPPTPPPASKRPAESKARPSRAEPHL